jgi:hypothetical protein
VKAPPRLFFLNSGGKCVGSAASPLYVSMKCDVEFLQDVSLDAPLRLEIAARRAFPDGSMTASGLRKEAGRGRLAIERVAGKDYTTLSAIAEMRKKCLLEPKGLAPVGTPISQWKTHLASVMAHPRRWTPYRHRMRCGRNCNCGSTAR